ncbi:MAG: ABC transporter ATP-binding protein [Capsulimonadaceae bacterium]|nr:ABC transporter ATP-binding protein [Capsulimonadaceae bacterium]
MAVSEPIIDPILSAQGILAGYSGGAGDAKLRDVSVDLRSGELVAVVGPNGSGKSTLMRALSRTLRPLGGAVLLDARDLYSETTARMAALRIGVVPQETSVAFDFTVREIVAMGRAPHQPSLWLSASESDEDQAAIAKALRHADIPAEFADRPISTLSGGERQRVLIARAIAQEAGILLLDEPTSALDLRHQGELLSWLGSLAREEGRVVFAALHDLNLAAQHADRVIVLCDGEIAACGAPAEALSAGIIERVYGVAVRSRRDPASGRPYFLSPVVQRFEPGRLAGMRVHLICGAGTGAELYAGLRRSGAELTVGALHEGDIDADAMGDLEDARKCIVPAFCKIDDQAAEAVFELVRKADIVIVASTPFGDMNAGNLRAAIQAAADGKRVLLCRGARASRSRGDDVCALLDKLRAHGGVETVDDPLATLMIGREVSVGA